MTIVTILQIITISISVLSIMINSIITVNEGRKNKFVSVTANQWKEMFVENRKHFSKLVTICSPECIRELKANGSKTYKNDLRYISVQLMYYWKLYYDEEAELIENLNSLVDAAYAYYDNETDANCAALQSAVAEFYKLSAIYDSADWRLVRAQASGHDIGSHGFKKVYEKGRKQFGNYDVSRFFKK